MGRNLMFPRCYYFSLECCSAACISTLTRVLRGQRPRPLWGDRTINKWVAISQLPLLFVSTDVSVWYPRHLSEPWGFGEVLIDRWALGVIKHGSSVCRWASPVPDSRVCLSAHPPACPSFGKSCQRRVAGVMARGCVQLFCDLRSEQPGDEPLACIQGFSLNQFTLGTIFRKWPMNWKCQLWVHVRYNPNGRRP